MAGAYPTTTDHDANYVADTDTSTVIPAPYARTSHSTAARTLSGHINRQRCWPRGNHRHRRSICNGLRRLRGFGYRLGYLNFLCDFWCRSLLLLGLLTGGVCGHPTRRSGSLDWFRSLALLQLRHKTHRLCLSPSQLKVSSRRLQISLEVVGQGAGITPSTTRDQRRR